MDISNILATAWAEVEKADLPVALQEAAFREAIRLLTTDESQPGASEGAAPAKSVGSKTPRKRAPRASSTAGVSTPVQDTGPVIAEDEFFGKVEHETGVSRDKLEQVFHLDDGVPQISLRPAQLGDALKDRMVAIAQILCVARSVAFAEDGTSMRVIRAECRRLRSLDDKNINKYLSNIDGLVYVGGTRDKRLKVRPAAERAFPAVIDKLLGGKDARSGEQS